MSLKQKAISGVKWTTFSTVITTVLQLLQLAILARFLEPTAFGLMALVMVVIGFSQAFLDMGISNAIIHKQEITKDQLSTLYWVNVLAGFLLFLIIIVIAPFVAEFYKEPELTELIFIVALTFIIQPFGQQFMVLWQKEMRFSEIAKIDIVNKSISLVVSVYLAYKGFGVYALVYGTLAGIVSQTVQFMYKGLKEYRPSFVFKLSEIKEFLSFGAYQMGEKTINYFNFQIDTILIGKLLGMEALGIYTIAKQIIMRPAQIINPIITKVTFPTMSKVQDDTIRLKNIYLKTINYLSSINFPIYAFIFVFAHEIVMLMFGEKWLEAVYIMQILSIWGAIRSTGNPIGSLLLAKGKANWGFWWNLGLFFYVPIGIYIGSNWGLVGISWTLVILMISLIIPNWYFLIRPLCQAQFIEYHKEIFIPAFLSFTAGLAAYSSIYFIEITWLRLLLGSLIGLVVVVGLNYIMNKKFLDELKGFWR
ncbi:MOP flippase family protein [Poseidonibacter antarcticus]|uniref:MOP flippase family protein n=1 Tax=Poseidonibacter antarcticus TaxID=2478538 RepID=UPI000EF46D89|nr:MOP flippase family protein [Poseidonibacter antarcticus]